MSNEEIQNQLIPWNTPERAIKGGAVFIGKTYILVGQNCLYLQKFDVNNDRSSSLFWHQYMTNCLAPYSESKSIYNGYDKLNMLNSSIGFVIPVYENMPSEPVSSPNISSNDFVEDNTKVYANVTGNLNVRSGPGTSYEILISIPANQTFTRIGKGVQNGERWDKILLDNGIIGYVFQSYVEEVPAQVPAQSIRLDINNLQLIEGKTMKINAYVLPADATNRDLIWSSENSNIAEVNQNGEIKAISEGQTVINVKLKDGELNAKCNINVINIDEEFYFELDERVTLNGDEISSINSSSVGDFKKLVNTNLNMEFYDSKGVLLKDDSMIGTGYRLCLKNDNGDEIYNYYFIIYGDVNGDGSINSLDVLVLQKYILEMKDLDELYLKAGNISKNGNLPSSLDVLKIQKHILEIKNIEQ